jgi:hypothetical protein
MRAKLESCKFIIILLLKENLMKSDRLVVTDTYDHKGFVKCFSWSAVFVGALVGLGLSFLLHLFGIAIGLTAYSTSAEGTKALAIGGFIGIVLTTIISMYVAGLATGYLARPYCYKRHLATTYGFTTWSVMLVVAVLLSTHMGRFVDVSTNMLSNSHYVEVTNEPSAPVVSSTDNTTTVNADKAANLLGTAAFISFFLFLVGAISSCLGAHHGLCCCRDDVHEIK